MSVVSGLCSDKFQSVKNAFESNFSDKNELGASLCIFKNGEKVVDLWGGYTDEKKTTPWTENTISIVFSCTKAMVALCAQTLIDRGLISLDEPVATYWPEFAQNGKAACTVRHLLSHQSGLPALRDPVKPGGYYDFNYMAGRLAAEAPFWEPGTDAGYHLISYGWTVGELIRRVSGKDLGAFFHDEIAGPLGADFHIGLDETEFDRMSKVILFSPEPGDTPTEFVKALMSDPRKMQFLAFMNSGGYYPDLPEAWQAQIGGGGGIGNARSMATIFDALRGDAIVSQERRDDMRRLEATGNPDKLLLLPTRMSQGFMLSMDNRQTHKLPGHSAILGANAFGHVGMGGSVVFYDTQADMAFAYSMNRMGGGVMLNARGQSLVDATYMSAGFNDIHDGAWQM